MSTPAADPFARRTRAPLDLERRLLVEMIERETPVTARVMAAFPEDQAQLKPHPRSQSALDLCWLFVMEMRMAIRALQGAEQLFVEEASPARIGEAREAFLASRDELVALLRSCSDDDLAATVPFPTGPGQIGAWPRTEFIRLMMYDHIHHRGQLSVYLRMAGGKVPSIYGPSGDEPWF